jgi:hypothetical protein
MMNYFPPDGHRHWVFTGRPLNQKDQGRSIQLMAATKVRIISYMKIRSVVNPSASHMTKNNLYMCVH